MIRIVILIAALSIVLSTGLLMASHSPTSDHCDAAGHNPEEPETGHEEHGDGLGLGHCTIAVTIETATNGNDADAAPGPSIRVGHAVHWTYTVTNVGDTDLTQVKVTDNQGVAVSCPTNTLAPGASTPCSADGVAVAGQYANVGTVTTAESATDSDPSHYLGIPPPELTKLTNDVNTDNAPPPTLAAGSTVTWTYTVTNVALIPLTNLIVTDQPEGEICRFAMLGVGESMTCTASGTVGTPPGCTNTEYTNTARVESSEADTASDRSGYMTSGGPCPPAQLEIEKRTNGADADAAPGPLIEVGQEITWTYVVTNTGSTLVTGISVTDDDDSLDIDCHGQTSLSAGASMTCHATGIATKGQYSNVGTAKASGVTHDSDPSHYFGTSPHVAAAIDATVHGQNSAGSARIRRGDTFDQLTVTVENIGDVAIHNPELDVGVPYAVHYPEKVATSQLRAAAATLNSGDRNDDNVLDPGEAWTFIVDDQVPILEEKPINALFTGETPAGTPVEEETALVIEILPGQPSTRLDLALTTPGGLLLWTTKPDGPHPTAIHLGVRDHFLLWVTEHNDSPDEWARFSDVRISLDSSTVRGLPSELTLDSPEFLGPDSEADATLAPGEAWRWRVPITVDGPFTIEAAGRAVDQFGQAHGYPGGLTFEADLDQHQVLRVDIVPLRPPSTNPDDAVRPSTPQGVISTALQVRGPLTGTLSSVGPVHLRIEEENDGDVPLTDTTVTLTANGRDYKVTFTAADPEFILTSDTNGNGRLDPGETWAWELDVFLSATTDFEVAATNQTPDGLHTHLDDADEQTDLRITVVPPEAPTLTIALETRHAAGVSIAPPSEFFFALLNETFTLNAPPPIGSFESKLAPGRYTVTADLPPDPPALRWQWVEVNCGDASPLARIDLAPADRHKTADVQVATDDVTCLFIAMLEPVPQPPSDLDLRLATENGPFGDRPVEIDSGDTVRRGVILHNRTEIDFTRVEVVLTEGDRETRFPLEGLAAGARTDVRELDSATFDDDGDIDATATGFDSDGNPYAFNPDTANVVVTDSDACICKFWGAGGSVICLLFAGLAGAAIFSVMRPLVPELQFPGRGPGRRLSPEPRPPDDQPTPPDTTLLILNANPDAREIHLATCSYASLIRAPHRRVAHGSAEQAQQLQAGAAPIAEIETYLQEGYDGCFHCLPQYHTR